ncbi:hypothetical protein DOTSEDRAFT_131534 [Dothistroma septosporum NZE10]|uniref:MmgE/PrpD family protein n=1 Tax=Dothistroma septosporum (strain NZE10 / CBS 128990) TaxID=675120 RepID=M2YM60_DOTSN|nr:hypothetical protein DOTSEDRAFT_131534 [Dothistroma septosporum NZE10]
MSELTATTNGYTTIPVTRILSKFIATSNTTHLTSQITTKVKEVLIDYTAVALGALHNASSTQPIYNAISALQGPGTTGSSTVIGHSSPHFLPQYASLLNSAFAHSLDYDDTYALGTLHAGVTAISAAMTQAELMDTSRNAGDFMLAISIGYEVTCRLGRELGMASYERGFHNTGTAGIFGAVAAIASLKRLSAEVVEMAFGLAGSKAAGSMQYLENGSWNKRLHPGFAVHDAFMCVSLAEAGVVGATKSIEGKMGFLQGYSGGEKDSERLVAGLGQDWVWLESSLKPYPACRMTHCFIEIAGQVWKREGGIKPEMVRNVRLTMPQSSFTLVGDPTPNKIHPMNNIDAQFSVYFQTANALLYGSTTGIQAYHKLQDRGIVELCDKLEVLVDEAMHGFAAVVQIEWQDGRVDKVRQQFPLGEVQHPFTRDRVDEKFHSLADPVYGEKKAQEIIDLIDNLEYHTVGELFLLLR